MKSLRVIAYSSLRGYGTNRYNRRTDWNSSKPTERHTNMVQENMPVELLDSNENLEFEDPDFHEADFTNVGEYYEMHKRDEEVEKLKTKNYIVKKKYFTNKEPSMLSWREKEKIRFLHRYHPEEWTIEKLCESFPATRDIVVRILRTNWVPKSTEAIRKYEETVKENWDLFRAGKLAVDEGYRAHLEKFKNRRIDIMDEESMQKFVKPKPVFPQPKSVLFSSIIKSYLDEKEPDKTAGEKKNEKAAKPLKPQKQISSGKDDNMIQSNVKEYRKYLTMDEFLEKRSEAVEEKIMGPFDRVILDEVKRKFSEAYKSKSLVLESSSPVEPYREKKIASTEKEANSSVEKIESDSQRIVENNDGIIGTGIIAREKIKNALTDDFPMVIRIPRNKFKRGATYRIEDRYYADNGEFLYRVPGLRS